MVGRPKMGFLKSTKGGSFGSAGGSIIEGKGRALPPPLNPPLMADIFHAKNILNSARALSKKKVKFRQSKLLFLKGQSYSQFVVRKSENQVNVWKPKNQLYSFSYVLQ